MRYFVGLAATIALASPASALVTYTLHTSTMYLDEYHIAGEYDADVIISITTPDFLDGPNSTSFVNTACQSNTANLDCSSEHTLIFRPVSGLSDTADIITFNFPDYVYYSNYTFQDGALSAAGTYSTYAANSSNQATATLTVASSAVPEAASWTMMISGFGAVGAFTRARKRRPSVHRQQG